MTQAPPGSRCSERAVVVCMPRLSCSRTAPVSCTALPIRVLVRVDLPAPDEPSSTSVCPPQATWAKRPALAGSVASTTTVGTAPGMRLPSAASALVAQRRFGRGDVGLGQDDDRRDAAGVDQRQVALEPAQVEVVVEAHDEQGPVDVADHRMAAAVAVAAGDVRERRHAQLHPARARGVARGEHPVADGEHRAAFEQLAGEPRHLAGRAFAAAVVQLHRLAVHGADPQQVEALVAARRQGAGAFGEHRREADALEPIEIEVLKHLESEAWRRPRACADADRRQAGCRNERCRTRRRAAPDSNDFGGDRP